MAAFTPVIIILVCILGLLLLPVILSCGLLVFFVGGIIFIISQFFPDAFNFATSDKVEQVAQKQYSVEVNKKSSEKVKPVTSKPISNNFQGLDSLAADIDTMLIISTNNNYCALELDRIYFDGTKSQLSKFDRQNLKRFAKAFNKIDRKKKISIIAYQSAGDNFDMLRYRKQVYDLLTSSGIHQQNILNEGATEIERSRDGTTFIQINIQATR